MKLSGTGSNWKRRPSNMVVTDKAHTPQGIEYCAHFDGLPATATPAAARPAMPQIQALFLVDTMHTLVAIPPALPAQHHQHALTAVVNPRLSNLMHPPADSTAVTRFGRVGKRGARHRHDRSRLSSDEPSPPCLLHHT